MTPAITIILSTTITIWLFSLGMHIRSCVDGDEKPLFYFLYFTAVSVVGALIVELFI